MTTLPPMYDNQAFEVEQARDDNSANSVTTQTISSSPPVKPQRSFRNKRQEEQENTAYLEGCDYMKEEERWEEVQEEEVKAGRSLEEQSKGCDGEVEEEKREFSGFYLLGEDGGSKTETEDECNEDVEEEEGKESREEKKERRQEEQVEEAGEQENRSKEDEEKRRGSEEEARGNKEKIRDKKRDEEEGWREEEGAGEGEKRREENGEIDICRVSKQSFTDIEEAQMDRNEQDKKKDDIIGGGGGASSSPPYPERRSRVIRLYQYDEDGQRYCHLPEPAPDEPSPAPRLRQRSVSLTRLNAIMAAASAGPLDSRDTGREERPHFHMEI